MKIVPKTMMKDISARLLLILIMFTNLSVPAQAQKKSYDPEQVFSTAALREDFKFMRSSLEEGHPTLYWYTTKEELDQAFDETYLQIKGEMTEREYLQLLMPLIEKVHCIHTAIKASKAYETHLKQNARYFPLDIWIDPGYKLWVRKNNGSDTLVVRGDQVLSINNTTVEQLTQMFVDNTAVDGYIETAKFRFAEKRFSSLLRLYTGEPDTFMLEVVRNITDTLMLKIPSLSKETEAQIAKDKQRHLNKNAEDKPFRNIENTESITGEKIYAKDGNEFRFIANDSLKTGYLIIKSFKGSGFNKLYKKTFRWLEEQQLENLVIDLRDNPGGSADAATLLMQYLSAEPFPYYKSITIKKRSFSFKKALDSKFGVFYFTKLRTKKKNASGVHEIRPTVTKNIKAGKLNYDGNVFVLTNGITGSASSLFAANMQYQKKAITIGEETGGGYDGCAGVISSYLTLPNSRVRVRFPLMQILTAAEGQEPGRGVLPDHSIPEDIHSIKHGIDKQLLYTLQLIAQKNKLAKQ